MIRPHHHYYSRIWRHKAPTGWQRVRILDRDLQPGGAPWVFQPIDEHGEDAGEPVAILCEDLFPDNHGVKGVTVSPAGCV